MPLHMFHSIFLSIYRRECFCFIVNAMSNRGWLRTQSLAKQNHKTLDTWLAGTSKQSSCTSALAQAPAQAGDGSSALLVLWVH